MTQEKTTILSRRRPGAGHRHAQGHARGDQTIELTAKEYALLEFFLRNKERVLSRTIICRAYLGLQLRHRHEPDRCVHQPPPEQGRHRVRASS
ncbi:MAG: winged helix-turn-helix domain-containing protein [Ignavibacteriales bacterium]|nr:winged helix-turn-helix domain-containing protein [Ignavibacteriales bacterium]